MTVARFLICSVVVSTLVAMESAAAFDAVAKGYAGYGGSTGHRTSGDEHGTAVGTNGNSQTTNGQSGQSTGTENATEAPLNQLPSSSGGATRGTTGGNPDCKTGAPNAADCGGPAPQR